MKLNNNPIVSIILPTFNREKEIIKAINSVINQTVKNWELVIVDNYSEDNTEYLVNSLNDPRIRFYKVRNNGLISLSRNFGIKKSNGKYIAFLDSDDWWIKDKLERSLNILNDGYDFVYHDLTLSPVRLRLFNKKTVGVWDLKSPVKKHLLELGNPIPCSSVVTKKSLIRKAKYFNQSKQLITMEDFDLWIRISEHTENFFCINQPMGYYKLDSNESSKPNISLIANKSIYNLHLKEIYGECSTEILPSWYLYKKARCQYQLNPEKSSSLLLIILSRNISFEINIKVLFMIISVFFKRIF
tara:strand:- start:1826 stop:2725 length:900 start_codon:yes stop_codon:yes gene_type:complete